MALPYLVLALSLVGIELVYSRVKAGAQARAEGLFHQSVFAIRGALEERMRLYADALAGLRGLVQASPTGGLREWANYARAIDLHRRYPGIVELGYVLRVAGTNLAVHIESIRGCGFTNYAVRPGGVREEYYPTICRDLMEAQDGAALGLDHATDPDRLWAMNRARDTGRTTATGRVRLSGGPGAPRTDGFAIYVPIYAGGITPGTERERRAALQGLVYATFDPQRLAAGLFGGTNRYPASVGVEVFADPQAAPTERLFGSEAASRVAALRPRFSSTQDVPAYGRTWRLRFNTLPEFDRAYESAAPARVLAVGLLFASLLFGIAWIQARARGSAEAFSARLSRSQAELQSTNQRLATQVQETKRVNDDLAGSLSLLQATLEATADGIIVVDLQHRVVAYNQRFADMWRVPPEVLATRNHEALLGAVSSQLRQPEAFVARLREVLTEATIESYDLVEFKDGRVFEHYSRPQRAGDRCVGRVCSFRDVTDRRRAEVELKEAHEHARNLIDSSQDIIISVDAGRRIIEFNGAAEAAFGYAKAEIIGKPVELLYVSPAEGARVATQTIAQGSYSGEVQNRKKDGTAFYSQVRASLLRDKHGKVVGLMGVSRDITELRRTQAALAQRERYLAALVKVQGQLLAADKAPRFYEPILASLGEAVGASRAYVFENHRDERGRLCASRRAEWCAPGVQPELPNPRLQGLVLAEAAPEFLAKLACGQLVNCQVGQLGPTERSLLEPAGVFSMVNLPIMVHGEFWGFLGFDNCVEARLWEPSEVDLFSAAAVALAMALERQEALGAVEESEERFRTIFELGSDAFFLLEPDPDGRLVMVEVNQTAAAMHGYTREELNGQPISMLDAPESARLVPERVQRLLAGQPLFFEVCHKRKDGSLFPAEVSAKLIHLHGKPFIHAVTRNVTEKKRLEGELLKASKLESIGVLAGGIAHDFNNVLTGILGNLSLAKMLVASGSPVAERLEDAERSTLRARSLTQQLLTFSKGGAPVKKTTRLNEFIRDSAGFALRGSNVRCQLDLPEDLWPVEADDRQMDQVIHHLVRNAVQAMPEGGTVHIRGENRVLAPDTAPPLAAGRYVRISVQDHGTGIPPEHLPRVFDPYFTTKRGGTGLGLATAYSIVQKHGGLITAESRLGQGSTFCIHLPAAAGPLPPPSTPPASLVGGTPRILVMDDEEVLRKVVGLMLERLGYTPAFARDGAEALGLFAAARDQGKPFAAVIMDLTIPGGMGGKEAIQHLIEIDPQVKAIVSSGYATDPIMAEFRDYGFMGVVAKPYQIQDLTRVLNSVLAAPPGRERRKQETSV
jgi:PAS domain S-box-containing protein